MERYQLEDTKARQWIASCILETGVKSIFDCVSHLASGDSVQDHCSHCTSIRDLQANYSSISVSNLFTASAILLALDCARLISL